MKAEWIINKAKEKIYAVSHAKAVFRGSTGNTVDNDLTNLETDVSNHTGKQVNTEAGAHNLRFYNGSLQYFNGKKWVNVPFVLDYAPGSMKSAVATDGGTGTSIVLSGADPDGVEADGSVLPDTWYGTKIVRREGGYPNSVEDGTLVVDYHTKNQYKSEGFTDTGLVRNTPYYYRWFPYSKSGKINNNTELSKNRAVATPTKPVIAGITVDFENGSVERTDDAVGLEDGAGFTSLMKAYDRKRCVVTEDGTILAFYGETGYTDTGALEVEITKDGKTYPVGTLVNVMVYQPKFYYQVNPLLTGYYSTGGTTVEALESAEYKVSDQKLPGFKVHPLFLKNGSEIPYALLAAYEATGQNAKGEYTSDYSPSKLRSVGGQTPPSMCWEFRRAHSAIRNSGSGWTLHTVEALSATQMLFAIEFAGFNTATFNLSGYMAADKVEATGTTSSKGNATGGNKGYGYEVTYRGEENLWGNTMEVLEGILLKYSNGTASGVYYNNGELAEYADFDNDTSSSYQYTGIPFPSTGSDFYGRFAYNEDFDWMFIPAYNGQNYNYDSFIGDTYVCEPATQISGDRYYSPFVGGSSEGIEEVGLYSIGVYYGYPGSTYEYTDMSIQSTDTSAWAGYRIMYRPNP